MITKILKLLSNLPTPTNINLFWNVGSLLGFTLISQIMSGLFLTIYYRPRITDSFNDIEAIITNINGG